MRFAIKDILYVTMLVSIVFGCWRYNSDERYRAAQATRHWETWHEVVHESSLSDEQKHELYQQFVTKWTMKNR
jgi:hypothetical protein